MLHIASHFLVPWFVGLVVYRGRWFRAALLMAATMAVDLDHLLAVPVYDPNRCSINFHPLHSTLAVVLYAAAFVTPLLLGRNRNGRDLRPSAWTVHVLGLGLLIHMALDWSQCLRQAANSESECVYLSWSSTQPRYAALPFSIGTTINSGTSYGCSSASADARSS